MTISLIHPSRSRPIKSYDNAMEWMQKAEAPCELIPSIDESDPHKEAYVNLYNGKVLISPNTSVVEATNMAAAKSTGDILVYLSDDFKCFQGWGKAVIAEFQKYTGPTLIKVDDCLQPFHVAVLTIPIMNRELYNKLGYFFHPAYKSMFVDEHLYWRTKRLHAMKLAPHLKFEHCHVSVGKAQNDETYRRSAANWDQGKEVFARHKQMEFSV
jgi:hypothetical protein